MSLAPREPSDDNRSPASPPPQSPPPPYTALTVGRVMAYTAAVLFVVFIANLLTRLVDIVFLLLIGILLATAINPAAKRLRRMGFNRPASILSIYLLLVIIVGTLIAFIIPPIATQATDFVTNLPRAADNFEKRYATSNAQWVRELTAGAAQKLRDLSVNPPDITGIVRTRAVSVVSSVFSSLLSVVTVLLISFYWLTERNLIRRSLLGFVPERNRERVRDVWDHIERKLGAWFRAQLILCAIIGVASAIFLGVMRVQYWPLLALIAAVTEIIPILGPWIGGIPAVFVALINGPVQALIVAVFIIILQQIEGNILVPRIQGDAIGLSPLTVILAILAGTTLAGPIGGILAVPISAMIQVLVQDLVIARGTPDEDDIEPVFAAHDIQQARREGTNPPDGTRTNSGAFRQLRRIYNERATPAASGPVESDTPTPRNTLGDDD